MKTINSSDTRFFNKVNVNAVIRLGPGGDFVQEFVPLADEPGALLEVCGLGPSGCGLDCDAGEVVGIGGALADVAGRLIDRLSVVARAVGLLSTADSLLERQQMALFRMRHLASTAADKLKVSETQTKSTRSSGFGKRVGSERQADGIEAGTLGLGSKLAFGRQSGSVCSSTGEVVGLRLGEGTESGSGDGSGSGIKATERAHDYELDTQAIEDSATDSGLARSPGVFADDAGAGRRNRRQQGHGVRARRSTDQEKRARARTQQGTLFVDC